MIEYDDFHAYNQDSFVFDGKQARVVYPTGEANGKWAIKTEYFGAFPETEMELLRRGWHVAYIENDNRWAENYDLKRKCEFIEFIPTRYDLKKKCAAVGMSCGGMYAVKTAALRPDLFGALYLDAPVMNLLSCPCGLGNGASFFDEYHSFTGRTISELLNYRDNPVDVMHVLAGNHVPIILVAGDSDKTVPYCENGLLLEQYYRSRDEMIEVHIKENCDHHPHGLKDPAIIADFLEKFDY